MPRRPAYVQHIIYVYPCDERGSIQQRCYSIVSDHPYDDGLIFDKPIESLSKIRLLVTAHHNRSEF